MKYIIPALACMLPTMAMAAAPAPLGSNGGKFSDWTAATYGSGADKICYAFTTAQHSNPKISGRGPVMLTVTERHGARDEVSIGAGYTYPKKASLTLTIGNQHYRFYTQGGIAFGRDGKAAVAAFKAGNTATADSVGPKGHKVEDQFSLSGFTAAYSAIAKACP